MYIYHKNQPNAGKYAIHGWYGIVEFISINITAICLWTSMFLVLYPANLAWIHKNGGVLDRGIYYILIYIYIYYFCIHIFLSNSFILGYLYLWDLRGWNKNQSPFNQLIFHHPQPHHWRRQGSRCGACPKRPRKKSQKTWLYGFLLLLKFPAKLCTSWKFGSVYMCMLFIPGH